jgi:hypothetical protein
VLGGLVVPLVGGADVWHPDLAADRHRVLVGQVRDGVDLLQPALETAAQDRPGSFRCIAAAPGVRVQVPADLDLAVFGVRQRHQQHRPDHPSVQRPAVGDLACPEAARRIVAQDPSADLLDGLVQVLGQHRLAVAEPLHDLDPAEDVERGGGVVDRPVPDAQAVRLDQHPATLTRSRTVRHLVSGTLALG